MTREEARQWFLKVYSEIKGRGYVDENEEAYEMAIQALSQEPKTGHWIYDRTIENWRCTECDKPPQIRGYVGTLEFMTEHFKYCPNCGACMKDGRTLDEFIEDSKESEDKE